MDTLTYDFVKQKGTTDSQLFFKKYMCNRPLHTNALYNSLKPRDFWVNRITMNHSESTAPTILVHMYIVHKASYRQLKWSRSHDSRRRHVAQKL